MLFENISNINYTLKDFPQDELYRLFVDADKVKSESGWRRYEAREPGCLAALCKAAEVAWFKDIENKELNEDLIHEIHKNVTTDVKKLNSDDIIPGEFRKNTSGFDFSRITEEGFFEILDLIQRQKSANYDSKEHQQDTLEDYQSIYINTKNKKEKEIFKKYALSEKTLELRGLTGSNLIVQTTLLDIPMRYNTSLIDELYKTLLTKEEAKSLSLIESTKRVAKMTSGDLFDLKYYAPAPHIVPLEMKKIIQSYNDRIKTATLAEEKIKIIADTIWEFNHTHPFRDANIRVFAILLCNRLLIQNGLGLAIFPDPNIFDNHGKTEVAQAIKEAIDIAKRLILNQKENKGFYRGFNTNRIPKEDLEQFRAWSTGLYSLAQGTPKNSEKKTHTQR